MHSFPVVGQKLIGKDMLQGRTKSDSLLDLFLLLSPLLPLLLFTTRIQSIHLYIVDCLGEPCPFAWRLNQMLNSAHLWMATGRKKLTHSLPEAGHSRRYLSDYWSFLTLFPHLFLSVFYKRYWHPDSYFEALVCHLLRLPAFWIKLYYLSQHVILDLLPFCAVSRVSLDSVTDKCDKMRGQQERI